MLSIFTPTYNRAYTLTRLFDSLKRQEVKLFEWIIIDDGSTDETNELVQKFVLELKSDMKCKCMVASTGHGTKP